MNTQKNIHRDMSISLTIDTRFMCVYTHVHVYKRSMSFNGLPDTLTAAHMAPPVYVEEVLTDLESDFETSLKELKDG